MPFAGTFDGTRNSHIEWSKSERERQTPHVITYVWSLKSGMNYRFTKHKRSWTCRKDLGFPVGQGVRWLGSLGLVAENIAFGVDGQWDPAV